MGILWQWFPVVGDEYVPRALWHSATVFLFILSFICTLVLSDRLYSLLTYIVFISSLYSILYLTMWIYYCQDMPSLSVYLILLLSWTLRLRV